MSRAPELKGEDATRGDPYALVVKINPMSVGTKVFTAQGRAAPGASGDPLITFAITAAAGTGDDSGKVIVTARLTGTQTRDLPVEVAACDLQYTDAGVSETLLRWNLLVFEDVTR